MQRPSQTDKPCDETADFSLPPQEAFQMTVDLNHESPEYQDLILQTRNFSTPTVNDFTEYVVEVDPQDFTDPSEWSATGEEDIDPCDDDIEF